MSDPTEYLLAQRYGGVSRTRRVVLLSLVGIVVVAALTWLGWAIWVHSNPKVQAAVSSYDIAGPHEARAQVDIRAGSGVSGTCTLRATAADHSIVGELNVRIHELTAREGQWISIRTEREATSVEVTRCTAR